MVDYGQSQMVEFENTMSKEEENKLLREITKEYLKELCETKISYDLYRTMNDYAFATSTEEEKEVLKKHFKTRRQLKARLNFLLNELKNYVFI